jgi:hypothetical protein
MEACAEHVQYQLPNQHSRVGFLFDVIQNNDAGVRTDDGPTGKRNDFEAASTHLLPYNPVAKKGLSGTKRGAGMISSVMDIAEDDQTPTIAGGEPANGKTGAHLRYHKQ